MSMFGSANRTTVSILDTITRSATGVTRTVDTVLNGVDMLHLKSSDYLADMTKKSEATAKVNPLRLQKEIALENLRLKRDLERELASLSVSENEWLSELAEVQALMA